MLRSSWLSCDDDPCALLDMISGGDPCRALFCRAGAAVPLALLCWSCAVASRALLARPAPQAPRDSQLVITNLTIKLASSELRFFHTRTHWTEPVRAIHVLPHTVTAPPASVLHRAFIFHVASLFGGSCARSAQLRDPFLPRTTPVESVLAVPLFFRCILLIISVCVINSVPPSFIA
jgi:hypothetical protein